MCRGGEWTKDVEHGADRQEEKRSPEKTILDLVEEDKHRVGMVVSRKGSSQTKTTVTSYGYTSD